MSASVEIIRDLLRRNAQFQEALLTELRLVNYGFSVEIEFMLTLDAHEGLVADLAATQPMVRLRLDGVSSLELVGGLSAAVLSHPDRVDWGLSEIALAEVTETEQGGSLAVRWEGDRTITVEFLSATEVTGSLP